MIETISIGCDHAGFPFKNAIVEHLKAKAIIVTDFGTHSLDSVDYPDFVHPVASAVENTKNQLGILICGSANGVAITANKHQHIRAAIAWLVEIAILARKHNNANIVCLPARFITHEQAILIVDAFIETAFEGGRHQNRINKINQF